MSKKQTIKIPAPKPRAKEINDILTSKKGGKMKNPADYDRGSERKQVERSMTEDLV